MNTYHPFILDLGFLGPLMMLNHRTFLPQRNPSPPIRYKVQGASLFRLLSILTINLSTNARAIQGSEQELLLVQRQAPRFVLIL